MVSIQPQGLHYNAPNSTDRRTHSRAVTTCSKKPHLHAGIKYDKIPHESAHAGELGLVKTGPTHTNVCDVRVVLVSR